MHRMFVLAAAAGTLVACGSHGVRTIDAAGTIINVAETDRPPIATSAAGCEGLRAALPEATVVACAAQTRGPRPFAALVQAEGDGSVQLFVYRFERSLATVAVSTTLLRERIELATASVGGLPVILAVFADAFDVIAWEDLDDSPDVAVHVAGTGPVARSGEILHTRKGRMWHIRRTAKSRWTETA